MSQLFTFKQIFAMFSEWSSLPSQHAMFPSIQSVSRYYKAIFYCSNSLLFDMNKLPQACYLAKDENDRVPWDSLGRAIIIPAKKRISAFFTDRHCRNVSKGIQLLGYLKNNANCHWQNSTVTDSWFKCQRK